MSNQVKRLILCCDGTWSDSNGGYKGPCLIPYSPTATLQVPSNVTRISRAFRKTTPDGKPQIIYYHCGVGAGSDTVNAIAGGVFGIGICENIREVYNFITANYTPGDEIIFVGFSRGAFTARSVANMIQDIGLLTGDGMEYFYPIFKDQQNFRNRDYNDVFPNLPFPDKPEGPDAAAEYKRRLEQDGLTIVNDPDGSEISVQAVAVWETVGALGIPQIPILANLGIPRYQKEYKFFDTNLSSNTRHAFQALALDERRATFTPAVWERKDENTVGVDLRQVWFPGTHSNVGGGDYDQEIANITLAWMMDQLASIGVAFRDECIDKIFEQNVEYYENARKSPTIPSTVFSRRPNRRWASKSVYDKHRPVRPFGLGKIYESDISVYHFLPKAIRTPGLYKRLDHKTGQPTAVAMTCTNERVHSSVRIRFELAGLGPDDHGPYKCPALTEKGPWQPKQRPIRVHDPIPWNATWGPETSPAAAPPGDLRWVWEYNGPEQDAPKVTVMVEDNLGPYQRRLLLLSEMQGRDETLVYHDQQGTIEGGISRGSVSYGVC